MQPGPSLPFYPATVRNWCFNPHPAFWPDATSLVASLEDAKCPLMFQSSPRPSGRMQRYRRNEHGLWFNHELFQSSPGLLAGCNMFRSWDYHLGRGVSILTRPSGRMQPVSVVNIWSRPHVSILTPAFWPDATIGGDSISTEENKVVSILTRPSGRMQLLQR